MRAFWILVAMMVLLYGDVTISWMVPEDADILKPSIEPKKNATTPVPLIKCKTSKNITGLCIKREHCNFGPGGIDFTLYAPRWYKKPCKLDEVCCPSQFIEMQDKPAEPNVNSDDYFQDDDNDY